MLLSETGGGIAKFNFYINIYIATSQENLKYDKKMKLKLRKIGNSIGVIIPKEHLAGYNIGDDIEVNVITNGEVITNKQQNVITPEFVRPSSNATEWCEKHDVRKGTCGCK